MEPSAPRIREKRTRNFVLKPQLDTKPKPAELETNTDGCDTDGGSVGVDHQIVNSQLSQSKDSSQGGFLVLKNGQLALKQRRMLDQLPSLAKQMSPSNRLLAPLPPKVQAKNGSLIFREGEIQPQTRFDN